MARHHMTSNGPVPFTAEEEAEWDAGEALAEANKNAMQASVVRQQRNEKLKDSDWTQVADAPVDKAAWAGYRQSLRDITSQSGFPFSINWPLMP